MNRIGFSTFLLFLVMFSLTPCFVIADISDEAIVFQPARQFLVRTFEQDGKLIDEVIVPGRPPENYRARVASVPKPDISGGVNVLSNVPAFDWSYGCSATSAAMIMGYYDNNGFPNMYTGPTNGGICPMNNSAWGPGECPLSATHMGKDNRSIRGHVDDYWRSHNNCSTDPFISNWAEHVKGDCTADFMGTNQSLVNNCDGATTFYYYTDGTPLHDYTGAEPGRRDGCHGMRLFAESRGYTVTDNFSQYIYGYGGNTKGFTFADYQAEINAGRPVMIQVTAHSMVGYGYDTNGSTVYIHDTWDHSSHTMTWGGSYSGMQHYAVTVFRLQPTATAAPVINPAGGTFVLPKSVTITCSTPGATIHYTTNGADPTTSSTVYTGPISINSSCTIKAKAWSGSLAPSGITIASFNITGNMSIDSIKSRADNALVGCESAVVSAAFQDFLYIEDDNRSSGIRVDKPAHGITSGRVRVIGTLKTNADGERCIEAAAVEQNGSGSVEPIALSNSSIGGGDWHYNPDSGSGQRGITGASGLNNIGLLVRAWGKVTHSGSGYFYIDDGSGINDGSGYTGIKVITSGFTPPEAGKTCLISGISSCYKSGGRLHRLIRLRSLADLQISGSP